MKLNRQRIEIPRVLRMTLRKQKANLENGTVAREYTCAWCVCLFVQAWCGEGEGGVSRGDRAIQMHT